MEPQCDDRSMVTAVSAQRLFLISVKVTVQGSSVRCEEDILRCCFVSHFKNCSIPITLVVLGAYFYTPPDADDARRRAALPEHREQPLRSESRVSLLDSVRDMLSSKPRAERGGALGASARKNKRPGETKTVIVAILSRMIITPLLLLPLMVLCTKFDLQEVFDECVVPYLCTLCHA